MADAIKVIVVGADEVARRIAELPGKLRAAQRLTVRRGSLEVARRIVERVSRQRSERDGQKNTSDFLNVRSGALRASVTKNPPVQEDALGFYAAVGFASGVVDKYAPVQEYGATINIPEIRPRDPSGVLHWKTADGQDVFARRARAHSVTIPERAPVRKSAAEKRDRINQIAEEETARALAAFGG